MPEQRICPQCGVWYTADSRYPARKFCTARCAYANRKARVRVEQTCRACGKTFITKRHEVERGGGVYCSRACFRLDPPRSGSGPEAAARMSVERRGEGNPAFRGGAAGLAAAHDRVRAVRGRASEHSCVGCGQTAYDWALSREAAVTRTAPKTGRLYSLDIEDYMPMCRRCHVHYDRGTASSRRI